MEMQLLLIIIHTGLRKPLKYCIMHARPIVGDNFAKKPQASAHMPM